MDLERVLMRMAEKCGLGEGIAAYGGESGGIYDIRYHLLLDIAKEMGLPIEQQLEAARAQGRKKSFTWEGPVW